MTEEPVLDLDDLRCANPRLAGAKASWLARGRHQGLSILPGAVIAADASLPALALGASALGRRGSGGARLEVSASSLDPGVLARLTEAVRPFGPSLAVRSSSVLEGDGQWAGAFSSYVDISPPELQTAVAGCWASTFAVATLQRFEELGLEPASTPMAVLVQPAIRPDFGGVARLLANDDVEVLGVGGSPAPLVQGWEPGVRATVSPSGEVTSGEVTSGEVTDGTGAVALLGSAPIKEVAQELRAALRLTGANHCEWALAAGRLWLLQLGVRAISSPPSTRRILYSDRRLIEIAGLARRYPGSLGEALVMAWAAPNPELARQAQALSEAGDDPGDIRANALQTAMAEAAVLVAETWDLPEPLAQERAARVLRQVRGVDPESALEVLANLIKPDLARAARVLRLLALAQQETPGNQWSWQISVDPMESPGGEQSQGKPGGESRSVKRVGADRWEPFQTAVVESFGAEHRGISASPGLGCGRLCFITGPDQVGHFRPRDVVMTNNPVPNLAPLLWDAAGLVSTSGSPAAHLFEAARSLNVPAVCAIDLSGSIGADLASATGRFALAVNGENGLVYVSEW